MTGMHRVPAGTKPPVPGDRGALPLLWGSEKPLDWGGADAPQQPPPHPTPPPQAPFRLSASLSSEASRFVKFKDFGDTLLWPVYRKPFWIRKGNRSACF